MIYDFKDPSDISSAEKYFNLTLDADGSGLVDVSEIVQWVRKVEPNPQFIIPRGSLEYIDRLQEFSKLCCSVKPPLHVIVRWYD